MRFDIVTLMPECFSALQHGLVGQALERKTWQLYLHHLRQFTADAHHTVDDRPFGGGDGMILLAEPLTRAVNDIHQRLPTKAGPVILLSAQGRPITAELCNRLAQEDQITLVCGRYGGVDHRFILRHVDLEITIGDCIVSGGELPAMMFIDALVRLIPGVLGNEQSARNESFYSGLLEGPQYTRPQSYEGLKVPETLLSGNHQAIARWRKFVSLLITESRRPELLTHKDQAELAEAHAWWRQLSADEKNKIGLTISES